MSIKDRLAKKTEGLLDGVKTGTEQPTATNTDGTPVSEVRAPRTGPGQMIAFRSHMQKNDEKVIELQEQLKTFEGSLPVKNLDPRLVRPSKWANRHTASYASAEFRALKQDIESAGANVQPILVRPLSGVSDTFEIVYGHRRHRACLELGIPVSAVIESMSDKELFAAMDRENRDRADLSPYEQGEMYRRALDEGLYGSLRQMAAELGVDPGNASKALAIARIPVELIAAFASPTEIQYRWGHLLQEAIQKDPDGIVARAKAIRQSAKKVPAAEVLARLIAKDKPGKGETAVLKVKGRAVGKLARKLDGSVQLQLRGGVLNDAQFKQLHESIEGVIGKA